MKKTIILLILTVSMFVIPKVFAEKTVEIKSIELDSKSDNVIINSEPNVNGLTMSYDLSFTQVNDFVKYKVIIANNTEKDYKISEETKFNESEYISYRYEIEGDLKANSETTIYVIITYNKAVDDSLLTGGHYIETNKAVVEIMNEQNEVVKVPNAGKKSSLLIAIIILEILFIIGLFVYRHKKLNALALLLGILFIPTIASAEEVLDLTINLNIDIKKGYEVKYILDGHVYFKENEMADYDLSLANCSKTFYNGEKTEDNKYILCEGELIFKGKSLHYAGDKVEIKPITLRHFYYENETSCTEEEENIFVCSGNIEQEDSIRNIWVYSSYYMNEVGYTIAQDDLNVMNFREYSEDDISLWESERILVVESPSSFTMPAHGVAFVNETSIN